MGSSKVTDYIIDYLEKNGIPAWEAAKIADIPREKLSRGYSEPLMADEFLELCVWLGIYPEEVAAAIRDS